MKIRFGWNWKKYTIGFHWFHFKKQGIWSVKTAALRWISRQAHVSTFYYSVLTPAGRKFFNPDELYLAEQLSRDFGSPVKKFIEVP